MQMLNPTLWRGSLMNLTECELFPGSSLEKFATIWSPTTESGSCSSSTTKEAELKQDLQDPCTNDYSYARGGGYREAGGPSVVVHCGPCGLLHTFPADGSGSLQCGNGDSEWICAQDKHFRPLTLTLVNLPVPGAGGVNVKNLCLSTQSYLRNSKRCRNYKGKGSVFKVGGGGGGLSRSISIQAHSHTVGHNGLKKKVCSVRTILRTEDYYHNHDHTFPKLVESCRTRKRTTGRKCV